MKTKIGMLSLGCARNLVDAEVMLGYLRRAGFGIGDEIEGADIVILNTCCFIREAEEESIDTILKTCQLKQQGKIGRIIVCGCLPQRYKNELSKELKEVDGFLGPADIGKIVEAAKSVSNGRQMISRFERPQFLYSDSSPRVFLTPEHFAYLKISDGCNHRCSFCIIPSLRGKHRSRPMDSIFKEAEKILNKEAIKEINLIGQDTTMYGKDLYAQSRIAELLSRLSAKAKGKWLRLLYAHPANFPRQLISVIKNEAAVCKYIDLPIQHINDKILKKMNRQSSQRQILSLIETLRKEIPGLFIRTTLIVGFPGETDEQFRELLDFIRQVRFERLGLFKYSRQSGSPAYNFSGQVPERVKQSRYDAALSLQQEISREINQAFLGKKLTVLIDQRDEQDKNIFLARTQYDAPEVDGCVYLRSKRRLKPGSFVRAKITDTLEYDLAAEDESTQ